MKNKQRYLTVFAVIYVTVSITLIFVLLLSKSRQTYSYPKDVVQQSRDILKKPEVKVGSIWVRISEDPFNKYIATKTILEVSGGYVKYNMSIDDINVGEGSESTLYLTSTYTQKLK